MLQRPLSVPFRLLNEASFILMLPRLSLRDVSTDAAHRGRRTFIPERDSANEYLSSLPCLPAYSSHR